MLVPLLINWVAAVLATVYLIKERCCLEEFPDVFVSFASAQKSSVHENEVISMFVQYCKTHVTKNETEY
uniref:Putative secreted protein n=1 Tax=Rhipicephalus microplus TaxID=6941 RepID=A0A6G5A2M4_RHIMP